MVSRRPQRQFVLFNLRNLEDRFRLDWWYAPKDMRDPSEMRGPFATWWKAQEARWLEAHETQEASHPRGKEG